MKKLIILVALLLACSVSWAEGIGDTLKKIPTIKQGIAFSVADSKINYLATAEVLKYKFLTLETGYAGWAENTGAKMVGVLSFDLLSLKKLGVETPILDSIAFRPGVYFGAGQLTGSWETDYGVSATLVEIKW